MTAWLHSLLCRCMYACLKSAATSSDRGLQWLGMQLDGPWVAADGSVDCAQLLAFKGICIHSDRHMNTALGALVHLCQASTREDKVACLLKKGHEGGCGIMLAQYAASPNAYFITPPRLHRDILPPHSKMQMDVRGNIMVCTLRVGRVDHIHVHFWLSWSTCHDVSCQVCMRQFCMCQPLVSVCVERPA